MAVERHIVSDIWNHIKSYIFPVQHNIKLYGRHLRKDALTMLHNQAIRSLPRISRPEIGPQILYSLLPSNMESIRLIYHVPVPSFRRVLNKDLWEQCVRFCPERREHYMVVEKIQYPRSPETLDEPFPGALSTDRHIDHAQYYRDNLQFHQVSKSVKN